MIFELHCPELPTGSIEGLHAAVNALIDGITNRNNLNVRHL